MKVIHQVHLEAGMLGELKVVVDLILVFRQQGPDSVLEVSLQVVDVVDSKGRGQEALEFLMRLIATVVENFV